MFIDLFVGHIDFRALRNDKGKPNYLRTRPLTFEEDYPDPRQNQFADRVAPRRGLLFQLPVERGRNIDCGPNRLLFHNASVPHRP